MINLIGALTLTAKLGICIAVFALLIVAEILALVMLVKWKKNYKSASAQEEAVDTQNTLEDTPQAVTSDDMQTEENAESPQEDNGEDNIPAESQEGADAVEEVSMDTQDATVVDEATQSEPSQESEQSQEDESKKEDAQTSSDNKWSAFAFAPIMLLSASAQVTSLRYLLYALIGVSVVLAAAVLITAVAFSKSLTKSPKEQPEAQPAQEPAPVEEPVAEETPVEAPVEEVQEPIAEEEPVVEESAEESVEDQIAEDELTAEEAEEPVVEEQQPVEEIEEEQPVEDEILVEEEQPAEEEVVVEETPVVEEKPKPAPVKREPKPRERVVIVDNVSYVMKDERFLFNPTDDGWYILLQKTFTAKLIQSEEYVKDYYTELKNELLSYKKVHARMSKKRESFNFGRTCLARLTIRGKTLRLHLALDANDYAETKYIVEDTSSVKSLADTPLMYRIKNDRRLKYAKDLIAAVMEKYGAVKQEVEPVDYTSMYPYEETEPLIERGLITRRFVKGKVPEDKGFDFAQKTFKAKLIQSSEVVKEYYSHLKNELLAHKKIHDRMSKKRESFRFGRDCVARMSMRGKTLKLYLALDPKDYVDTKYKVEDASDVKSYADTPLVMKIKNPRRLKYALELIDVVMEKVGAQLKRDLYETDYVADLPFESTEDLMEKGLVVNVHVQGNSFMGQRLAMRAKSEEDAEDEVASDEDNE